MLIDRLTTFLRFCYIMCSTAVSHGRRKELLLTAIMCSLTVLQLFTLLLDHVLHGSVARQKEGTLVHGHNVLIDHHGRRARNGIEA